MGDKMNRYEKAAKLSDNNFKQIIGVEKEIFGAMAEVLSNAYAEKHKRRGRHMHMIYRYVPFNYMALLLSCQFVKNFTSNEPFG